MHGPLFVLVEQNQEVASDCINSARQIWSWAAMASVPQCVQRCELPGQTWNRSASRCLGFLRVLQIVITEIALELPRVLSSGIANTCNLWSWWHASLTFGSGADLRIDVPLSTESWPFRLGKMTAPS